MQVKTVETDVICELASELVERQWNKNHFTKSHSFKDTDGTIRYIDEVQEEFNQILDILNDILNPEI